LGSIPVVIGTPIPGDGYEFEDLDEGEICDSVDFGNSIDEATTVVARHIFYNQSKFDGNSSDINASDDVAIATDKVALQFSGNTTAPLSAFTSYSRGINGVMVDVADAAGTLTLADFTFKVGTSSTVSGWANAPAPSGFSVRAGAGVGGSDRVEIIWANNAIQNSWLQVIVEGNDSLGGNNTNTGLATSDRFYFGSRVGDSGSGTPVSAVTNLTDEQAARNNAGAGASVTNLYDYDRNGNVQLADSISSRSNVGTTVKISLTVPPAAPEVVPLAAGSLTVTAAAGDQGAIAAGLTLLNKVPAIKIPSWIANRLNSVNLNEGPVAQVFAQLAESGMPRAKAANKAADRTAAIELENYWLLESLIDDLVL
jgi:hypothetical protein